MEENVNNFSTLFYTFFTVSIFARVHEKNRVQLKPSWSHIFLNVEIFKYNGKKTFF